MLKVLFQTIQITVSTGFLAASAHLTILAQDNLVLYEELTFSSAFEKAAFDNHFIYGKTDHFDLLMANGSLLSEGVISNKKELFKSFINGLEYEKMAGKKDDKKVKFIYDQLHRKFLMKYEEQNRFEEIFISGYYNCVSASALYALAFDKLKIPYSIKESPSHVYLVAFPHSGNYVIETTTPASGYYQMSPSFKQNYVKTLKDQKVISQQEFISKDVNRLFEQYYFNQQGDIFLLQLIGIQYLNDALYKLDRNQFSDAFNQLEKAYMLYPSDRVGYLLTMAGAQALSQATTKDESYAILVAKLSRYERYGITPDMIKGEFARILFDLLPQKNKSVQLQSIYTLLTEKIQNIQIKKEIDYLYLYESGRQLHNQFLYKQALPYFEKAFELKPDNYEASNAFLNCLGNTISQQSYKDALNSLESYGKKFTVLNENNIYNLMLASVYLAYFSQEFETNRPQEGEKFRTKFEALVEQNKELPLNLSLLGHAYSTAAVYYFRKGQTSKAKNIINRGLQLSPDNPELLIRLEMLR